MWILLLNGPNLNLLGTRAPEVYGATTLAEVEEMCRRQAARFGHRLDAYQSNREGDLIDAIHDARDGYDGIVFNPGAYTHTSYALHDAIEAVDVPTVEVHISNILEREPWRRVSRTGPACVYRIFGRGVSGYLSAISHLHYREKRPPTTSSYGSHPDQEGDLRLPDGAGPHPVAVLIHGGGWTAPYTRDAMDGMAVELAACGLATWNIEYRRIPPVGGWRNTVGDVVAGVDHLAVLADRYPLDPDRLTLVGHSSGSQLGCLASRRTNLRPAKFVSLAGLLDFENLGSGFDPLIAGFLGNDLEACLHQVDPIRNLPLGVPIVAIHGECDAAVSPEQSRRFAEAAEMAGDEVRLVEIGDVDHEAIVDPRIRYWETVSAACMS